MSKNNSSYTSSTDEVLQTAVQQGCSASAPRRPRFLWPMFFSLVVLLFFSWYLHISTSTAERIETACQNGYDVGYGEGRKIGESLGYASGYEDGYKNGKAEGFSNGYEDGFISGMRAVSGEPAISTFEEAMRRKYQNS